LRKPVTVREVAKRAGVAISSVSRVVNDVPTVAADVRERVLAAIHELGWTPNLAAQHMRGISTRMIGFMFPDIRNPLYATMVQGAEDFLIEHGYMVMVASTNGSSERELALLDLFAKRGADGIILTVGDETNPAVIDRIGSGTLPVVLLEREMPTLVNAVGVDHFDGALRATGHLLSLGHRRIALITGGNGNRVARDRVAGVRKAHVAHHVELDPSLIRVQSFATAYAFRETQMLMGLPAAPTAILAFGMHTFPGVLSALRLLGLAVPRDISLIASNDCDLAQLATPAITVIRYDAYALGREAAGLLLRQLSGDVLQDGTRVQLATEFILRESCAPPQHLQENHE
jgi:LacI family transcriptional regulator